MRKNSNRITPIEAEENLQKVRIETGFVDNVENITIKNLIEQARITGVKGDKILLVVNPLYIHIPFWQRTLDIRRATDIGINYLSAKWELPKVYMRNGKFYGADGMHRLYGAFLAKKESVTMEFIDVTEIEAIKLFLNQTVDRRKMAPADILKAAIQAKIPEWVEFQEICHDNGVNIIGDCDNIKDSVGTFTPILDGVKECRNTPERFDFMLKLLKDLQWGEGSYNSKVIRTFKNLFAFYGTAKTEKALLCKCKGRAYFEANISPKNQYPLFDFLSDVIATTKPHELATFAKKRKAETKANKPTLTEALQMAVLN